MRKIFKNDIGITLIALVITIIVLLILAGVTIAMLTGENGILTQASQAKKETEIAEAKERAQMDILAWQSDRIINNQKSDLNDKIIQEILTNLDNKEYIGEIKEHSFTTNKNNYEILFSELYSEKIIIEPYGKGDINYDGVIDNKDLELLTNHTTEIITLEGEQFERGDINSDGEIKMNDQLLLLKYIEQKG